MKDEEKMSLLLDDYRWHGMGGKLIISKIKSAAAFVSINTETQLWFEPNAKTSMLTCSQLAFDKLTFIRYRGIV